MLKAGLPPKKSLLCTMEWICLYDLLKNNQSKPEFTSNIWDVYKRVWAEKSHFQSKVRVPLRRNNAFPMLQISSVGTRFGWENVSSSIFLDKARSDYHLFRCFHSHFDGLKTRADLKVSLLFLYPLSERKERGKERERDVRGGRRKRAERKREKRARVRKRKQKEGIERGERERQ